MKLAKILIAEFIVIVGMLSVFFSGALRDPAFAAAALVVAFLILGAALKLYDKWVAKPSLEAAKSQPKYEGPLYWFSVAGLLLFSLAGAASLSLLRRGADFDEIFIYLGLAALGAAAILVPAIIFQLRGR
jgi:hypothetical protein